jgi:NAD(P)-dependent dehydrogenase (short-subunit alcohol dehydrogenase family)
MTEIPYRTALIVGAGSGISASVARGLATAGLKVELAARNLLGTPRILAGSTYCNQVRLIYPNKQIVNILN